MKKFFKKTEGFTLVELIVVIAILGILAGVGTVGYSGYIKKAQIAADNQLLAAVNQAYAAACIENGEDTKNVTARSITIDSDKAVKNVDKSDIVVTNPSAKATAIQNAFEKYFAGNEGSEFKVFTTLTYNKASGSFVYHPLAAAYAALLDIFSETDVEALNESQFAKMGVEPLLDKVDFASDIAFDLINNENPDPRMVTLVSGDANRALMMKNLGLDPANYEGGEYGDAYAQACVDIYLPLLEKKSAQLLAEHPEYATLSEDELTAKAEEALMTNNAVWNVALNNDFDYDTFANTLKNGGGKDAIKANLATGGDVQDGLAQAALTYGLYTTYASRNNIQVSDEATLDEVLNALDPNTTTGQAFAAYMATDEAKKDIDGYKAAMNMVYTSSSNTEVISDILLNGFTNDDLMVLMQSTLG